MFDASIREPDPQGDGAVVLDFVLADLANPELGEIVRPFVPANIYETYFTLLGLLCELKLIQTGKPTQPFELLAKLKEDLVTRAEMGEKKYGTKLRVWNGRNATNDLTQELYDAVMYCRQEIQEGLEDGHGGTQ